MKNLQLICAATLTLALAAPLFGATRAEQNLPPVISHFPVIVAYRGQPVPVYTRVTDDTGKIKSVSLFYTLQQQVAPVEVKMKRLSDGRYSGLIPANFFFSSPTLWYYIEARDSFDDKAETTWYPVQIKNPDTNPTQDSTTTTVDNSGGNTTGTNPNGTPANNAPGAGSATPGGGVAGTPGVQQSAIPGGVAASASPAAGTAFPPDAIPVVASGGGIGTGVIIGGVLVAGGGAAVAAGGGGGGGSSDGGGGGGGGFDPSSAVIVHASSSASGGFSGGPQDKVINGSGVTAGKTITGVRVTVNYQAYSLPDKFQVLYRGNVIANSGEVSGAGSIQGTSGGSDPLVTIRVLTKDASTAWTWSATVEFSAK